MPPLAAARGAMDALRTPVSYLLFDICRHRTNCELCSSQDGPMETRRKGQRSDGTEMLRELGGHCMKVGPRFFTCRGGATITSPKWITVAPEDAGNPTSDPELRTARNRPIQIHLFYDHLSALQLCHRGCAPDRCPHEPYFWVRMMESRILVLDDCPNSSAVLLRSSRLAKCRSSDCTINSLRRYRVQ